MSPVSTVRLEVAVEAVIAERYDLKRAFSTDTGWFRDLKTAKEEFENLHIAPLVVSEVQKDYPFHFSTCGSALACYEQQGGIDFVCNEMYAVGCQNLAYTTSECRATARKYGPEWWSAWYAHDWYSKNVPYESDQKFELLKTAFKQGYVMGTSMMVLESGTQIQQAWEYTMRMDGKYPDRSDPALKIPPKYDDPVPQRYRREMKAFWEWLKAHPRVEGSPETKIAVALGNLDSFVGGCWDGWPCWAQHDTAATNKLYRLGAPERTWTIVQDLLFPRGKDALKPYWNYYLSGSPYGQVDVTQIDDTLSLEQLSRYRLLVFAGWNTMTEKIRDTLVEWVKNGGTLVLCRPHLLKKVDRGYLDYTDDDLIEPGFTLPPAGTSDDHIVKNLGRGKVVLFTAKEFPADKNAGRLAETYRKVIVEAAVETRGRRWIEPVAGSEGDVDYISYANYGDTTYVLNLDCVAVRKIRLVSANGSRELLLAPGEMATIR